MVTLTRQLRNYARNYVDIEQSDKESAFRVLKEYITDSESSPILGYIRRNSIIPIEKARYTGSAYEGVSTQDHDFDIMLMMKTKTDNTNDFRVEPAAGIPGYARLKYTNQGLYNRFLARNGYLDVEKLLSHLESLTDRAINAYESQGACKPYRFKSIKSGPAIQVNVYKRNDPHTLFFSVDLVMCFQVGNEYYVTKMWKGSCDYDKETLMRQSFSLAEKRMLNRMDQDGGCRKELLRILKTIVRRDFSQLRTLSSYHMKTAILLFNKDSSLDWSNEQLGERFLGFLTFLESKLRLKWLPHFFISNLNLLEDFNHSRLCETMAARVRRLLNSKQERDSVLSPCVAHAESAAPIRDDRLHGIEDILLDENDEAEECNIM